MASNSGDEWLQFYQQNMDYGDAAAAAASSVAFSDATVVTTCGMSDSILSSSPASATNSNSCTTSDQLNPKGCVSKPVRRRSRGSKKTPTTLLNANTNNFRSLVQKFTGCPSRSPFAFGSKNKGPVNLSFGLGNDQNQRYTASLLSAPYGNSYYNYQQAYQPQQAQHQARLAYQQQLVSFDHINVNNSSSEGVFATSSDNSRANNFEIPEGFTMDDISFNEFSRDVFPSQDRNDNGYFL